MIGQPHRAARTLHAIQHPHHEHVMVCHRLELLGVLTTAAKGAGRAMSS